MKKYFCVFLFFTSSYLVQAETSIADRLGLEVDIRAPVESKAKKYVRKGLKCLPGGEFISDILGLGDDSDDKIDRIEKRQENALDQLRYIARKALQTKEKVEEMYYFKKRSQQRAEEIVSDLKRSEGMKWLGAIAENFLGFPINPAAYIPDTDQTKELRKKLNIDLSLEKGLIQRSNYLLNNTRAALAEYGIGGKNTPQKQFNTQYTQAEAYEKEVTKALKAKRNATLKLYQAEIKSLEKEITLLEKAKEKKGLTVGDVMQIEQTLMMKRNTLRELHEKITTGIEEGIQLSEDQKELLMQQKIAQDTAELEDYFAKERRNIRAKYGHLWRCY